MLLSLNHVYISILYKSNIYIDSIYSLPFFAGSERINCSTAADPQRERKTQVSRIVGSVVSVGGVVGGM